VKGNTGFVCNRYLRLQDGHVVCKELQMGKAVQVYATEMYSYYHTPLLIKNPGCIGTFVIDVCDVVSECVHTGRAEKFA
jgi:hypothetical protein